MIQKHFSINEGGHSIRCKIYANDLHRVKKAVIFGHGFGGHKDNKAAERFADRILPKEKEMALVTFDWPCHGDDATARLTLEACMDYLGLVIAHVKDHLGAEEVYGYATSFGGYLFLLYTAKYGMPFKRLAMRCPAISMYDVLVQGIIRDDDMAKLAKGKPALVGFDRKVKVDQPFLDSLKEADIRTYDYLDYAEDILILYGTKDEIIPRKDLEDFAENNLVELEAVENADHRFSDPKIMDAAIHRIYHFLLWRDH